MKFSPDTTLRTKQLPRQERALKRIRSILAAAAELIAEQGYEHLSMVGIAARAGITHTSMYRYFGSMEDLLAALLEEYLSDFDQRLSEQVAAANSPQEMIEAILLGVDYGFQMYRSIPAARGLWSTSRYLQRLREIEQEDSRRMTRMLQVHLQRLRPDIDPADSRLKLELMNNLVVPAYEFALLQPVEQQEAAMQAFCDLARQHLAALFNAAQPAR